jgi:hypothetical protein
LFRKDSTVAKPTTTKLSMTIHTPVYEALEKEARNYRRDFYEHIQRILAEHVIETKSLPEQDAVTIKLTWRLVDQAVDAAKAICREGKFDEDVTLRAIQRAKEDPQWIEAYTAYVRDDIYKSGNPRKGPINREIGFRIREGIGGTVSKGPEGKPTTKKVLGEIIQSYTPMVSFDPEAVAVARSRGTVRAERADAASLAVPPLDADVYEMASEAAPGWDIRVIEQEWRSEMTEAPKNPELAFLTFCRKWERRGRP